MFNNFFYFLIIKNKNLEAVFTSYKLGNYEPVNLKRRSGPGEGGVPVILSNEQKERAKQTVREYGFNMVASGLVSMDRRIKDTRPNE